MGGGHPEEIEDPRLYAEIIRQWSTLHPEFTYLPRKFKIAITAAKHDRAAIRVHDIGLRLYRKDGQTGFEVIVGGGLGRTPFIGKTIRDFLPREHLLSYLEERSCARTMPAGAATTSTRPASRSRCMRSAPRNSPAGWKRNGRS